MTTAEITQSVGGMCAFCDNMFPTFEQQDEEGEATMPEYTIIRPAPHDAFFVCGSCWQIATRNAHRDDIQHFGGMHTLYAHA